LFFGRQVVPRGFLTHTHTQPPLHIPTTRYRTPPDINVRVDGLTDIFAFCQFNAMTTSFLKLHINSCFYYASYDIFNILQGRAFLALKKNPCSQHLPVHKIKFSHFHLSKFRQHFQLRFPVMLIGSQVSIKCKHNY
jgi:hypothetical protein